MNVAATYNNLGVLARKENQYKEAEAYHQKALRLRMEKLGENHVDVADTYNNLGTVCHNQNMHEKARDYYQKALNIKRNLLREGHPSVVNTENNLSCLARELHEKCSLGGGRQNLQHDELWDSVVSRNFP